MPSLDKDAPRSPVRFGIFEVDFASGELRRQGVRIKLQEQPFQALIALLQRPREVLTREELQKRLWPGGTVVDFDRGLSKAINRLREALGDDADNPRFIETLPQRGYRFIAQVETAPAPLVLSLPPPETAPGHAGVVNQQPLQRRRRLLAIGGGLIAVLFLAAGLRLLRSPPRPIESIAVLPLENLSGDPAQEYFSDGMTDELIGEIARIGSLKVISRTSIMQYKGGARKSLPAIARELNVDAIVEGTVLLSGRKVRITTQLIRAYDDRHLWSETYERDLGDVLALQSEVARTVASQIEIKLTPQQQTSLARTRRVNPEAYEAFLRGNFSLHQGMRGLSKSIEFFSQAIKIDPSQADAHVGLAQALCYLGLFGVRPSAETYAEARVAALKALELDESNAGAHSVLAGIKQGYDWDLAGANVEYQRALQLKPSDLPTRLYYAEYLSRLGRHDEAVAESRRTLALDPVSPLGYNNLAMLLWRAHRYDEAIRESQRAIELDPNFVNAFWWQGLAYAGKRDFPKSIACLKKAISLNDGPLFRALLGYVYGRAGERAKALSVLEWLATLSKQRYVSPVDFAVVYAGLGDADATFHWLEKAYQTVSVRPSHLFQQCV
jgi:TolB-like protein/DNA-binding winged helix-turn-helix (wHTH) protein